MYFGNIKIKEQFLGDTPIKSIWLGTSQVWSAEYTYEISNIQMKYSSGSMLLCNGANSAYITCTLKTYDRTKTLIRTETDVKMNVECAYPTLFDYMVVDGVNLIKFNLAKYGTSDMSYFSGNNLSVQLKPYINGLTGSSVNITIEKNVPITTTYSGQINSAYSGIYKVIPSYATSVYLTLRCYERITTTYKSGKTGVVDETRTGVVINENTKTVVGSNSYSVSAPINANQNSYPVLHCFRISEDSDAEQYLHNDYYLYLMQKSNVNRTENICLFYGSQEVGEDYNIQSSSDIILMNDAHKDGITYSFNSSNQSLTFEVVDGVIFIEGVTSSDEEWVTIEVEDEDGNCEEITFNIIGV